MAECVRVAISVGGLTLGQTGHGHGKGPTIKTLSAVDVNEQLNVRLAADDKRENPAGRLPRWGWALFESKDPNRNVATDYRTDCRTCHVPAKRDDWVYVRGCPVLAKPTPPK
jgi:hypothetical protein